MKLTRTFTSGVMNKDLDERLIPDGQYRHAENINIGFSEASDVGAIENVLGNSQRGNVIAAIRTLISNPSFNLTNPRAIGACPVPDMFMIYWMIAADNANVVASYNEQTGLTTIHLFDSRTPNVLNFNKEYLITGINYVDGLLYWTDNLNQPRCLDTGKKYAANTFLEEEITVIVKPPLYPLTITPKVNPSIEIGDNLSTKFLYFAYRYKYINNEYSSLSPFTDVAFDPSDFSYDYTSGENDAMQNKYNTIDISFPVPSVNPSKSPYLPRNVVEVQLVFRDTRSGNVSIIDTLRVSDIISNKLSPSVSYNSFTNVATFAGFNNNKIYSVLPISQVTRLFDNVPLKAKAQEFIGTRLVYGNYTQFFNITNANGESINPSYTVSLKPVAGPTPAQIGVPTRSMKSDRDYEVGICYLDEYGRMSTVLTSLKNTIYIPASKSDYENKLVVTINSQAPSFAKAYRIMIKQGAKDYYTIYPTIFYSDGVYKYFLVNKSDIDKVKENDYVVIKSSPLGITHSNQQYKILDVEVKEKDFLNNGQSQLAGVYIKMKIDDNFAFEPSSLTTIKTTAIGANSARAKKSPTGIAICSNGAKANVPISSPRQTIERPIFYGTGLNDLAQVGFVASTVVQDVRYIIQIDGVNTFKYSIFNQGIIQSGVAITGGNQNLKDKNGNDFITIKFGSVSGHTVGDSWRLNVRARVSDSLISRDAFGYFNGQISHAAYPAIANPFGGTAVFPGVLTSDLAIKQGAIIKIKIDETKTPGASSQDEQIFISSRNYENIEEWFVEDGAYSKFKMFADGDNKGPLTVWFRRCSNWRSGNIDGRDLTFVQNNDEYNGQVRMFVTGHSNQFNDSALDCTRSFLTVEFSITQSDYPTILESVPDSNDSDIFHEALTLPTSKDGNGNNWHVNSSGVVQNAATPLTIQLDTFNCFQFRNGVESDRIKDDFNETTLQYSPRALAPVINYEQDQAINGLTYSGVYRENSNINRLNEFNLSQSNFRYIDLFFGNIEKLYARDTDLLVFQENKISKILYGKNLISDSIGGGSIVTVPEVLGSHIAFIGEYGISNNPESFSVWGDQIFFTDARRGVVIRLLGDDLEEISAYGMRDWFKDLFRDSVTKQRIGAFDPYDQQYVIASNDFTAVPCQLSISPSIKTISLDAQSTTISIFSSVGWTITGAPSWLTVSPGSGTGNQTVTLTATKNTGLSDRTANLIITNSCGLTKTYTLTQKMTSVKTVGTVVVSGSAGSGSFTQQKYVASSSPSIEQKISNVVLDGSVVPLFSFNEGVAGTPGIPAPGDTVTIAASTLTLTPNGDRVTPFVPGTGNKLYYLSSDTQYTNEQIATLIGLATPVPVSLSTGEYTGSFVYNPAPDENYLYLIYDYRNLVSCGSGFSYSGQKTDIQTVVDFGSSIGIASVNSSGITKPVRVTVSYAGNIAADTKYVGLNSLANYNALIAAGVPESEINLSYPYDGTVNNGNQALTFFKSSATIEEAIVTVYAPIDATTWTIQTECPGLRVFLIDSANGTLGNVCDQTSWIGKYHNGSSAFPVAGNKVYNDSAGVVLYNGGNAYHKMGDNDYALISDAGVVLETGNCTCTESAPPIVIQSDIRIPQGETVNIKIDATNSPSSFSIAGNCETYELYGGTDGAVFYGANCENSVYEQIAVSADNTIFKCFLSGTVTKLSGSANATYYNIGGCGSYYMPNDLDIDLSTGVISGVANEQGVFEVSINATNCVGTGPDTTFKIYVDLNDTPATKFGVNLSGQASSSAACALSANDFLYHDGYYAFPIVGDTIYIESRGGTLFAGGNLWYKIDNSQSIQIDNEGVVLTVVNCASSTTTTTLPSGIYYAATLCGTTYSSVLFYGGIVDIPNGTILKSTNGNCWTIDGLAPSISYIDTIPDVFSTYISCESCTAISTTTTTTTSTTTAPPTTSFSMDGVGYGGPTLSCEASNVYTTMYHNGAGATPVAGDFVYNDAAGLFPFAGGGEWYQITVGPDKYVLQISDSGQVIIRTICTTTTTTTTTSPSLTPVNLTTVSETSSIACGKTVYDIRWTDGVVGINGTLYMDDMGMIIASAGWYRENGASISYFWSGVSWTSSSSC